MPGGGGIEIWRDLAARGHPLAGRFVFVTGDTVAGPPAIAASQDGRAPLILEKPFGRAEVGEALRAATA
jgi:FixJ family two-component response regulator